MFDYEIDMEGQDFGDHFKPSVIISCNNCSTIHCLENKMDERSKS